MYLSMLKFKMIAILMTLASSLTFAAVNESQFEQITDEIKQEFQGDFQKLGLRFVLNKQWKNTKRDAGIKIPKGEAILTITGEMARDQLMSEDGLRLLLCHEIGHVLGGAPKSSSGHWSSNEGQADYYATSKCINRIIENDDRYNDRVVEASLVLAKMLAISAGKPHEDISISNKDITRVSQTYNGHPNAQCRLDTLLAGLTCPISPAIGFSDSNPNQGACLRSSINEDERDGARPRCWYRPEVSRLACVSNEKIPQFGGNIPVISVNIDDLRDDHSLELQVGVAIFNPLTTPRQRARLLSNDSEIENTNYYLKKINSFTYEFELSPETIEKILPTSLIPVKWSEVPALQTGSDKLKFILSCKEI